MNTTLIIKQSLRSECGDHYQDISYENVFSVILYVCKFESLAAKNFVRTAKEVRKASQLDWILTKIISH